MTVEKDIGRSRHSFSTPRNVARPKPIMKADCYIPSSLINSFDLVGPKGVVNVKGIVKNCRPYPQDSPRVVYADLDDGNAQVQIVSSYDNCPQEGDRIVFSGTVKFSAPDSMCKFRLQVVGEPVGKWSPHSFGSLKKPLKKDFPEISMKAILKDYGVDAFQVIGTRRAIDDFMCAYSNSRSDNYRIKATEVSMTNKNALLKALQESAENEDTKVVIFTRGGVSLDMEKNRTIFRKH